jgi:hypothetical protein
VQSGRADREPRRSAGETAPEAAHEVWRCHGSPFDALLHQPRLLNLATSLDWGMQVVECLRPRTGQQGCLTAWPQSTAGPPWLNSEVWMEQSHLFPEVTSTSSSDESRCRRLLRWERRAAGSRHVASALARVEAGGAAPDLCGPFGRSSSSAGPRRAGFSPAGRSASDEKPPNLGSWGLVLFFFPFFFKHHCHPQISARASTRSATVTCSSFRSECHRRSAANRRHRAPGSRADSASSSRVETA